MKASTHAWVRVGLAVWLATAGFDSTQAAPEANPPKLRIGTFRCDATPPRGETLIWLTRLKTLKDPLLAKGVVLEDGGKRHVLCAIDWCLLCNESEWSFRETLARAAGTLQKLSAQRSSDPRTESWEATNLLTVASAVVAAAARRHETRGSHWREDFGARDDEHWLVHLDSRLGPDGSITLDHTPATANSEVLAL